MNNCSIMYFRRTYSSILTIGCLLALAIRASAQDQCRSSIPFHEVFLAPEGILTIDDEDGSRQIRGTIFNTPDCQLSPRYVTGSSFDVFPDLTTIAQNTREVNGCEFKVSGAEYTIDSFQAVVLETNGWPLNDLAFNISDIDAASKGWREAAAVFGVRNGELVLPNVILPADSRLRQQNFIMPEVSNSLIGLSLGTTTIPGVVIADPSIFFCPNTEPRASTCRASISFSVPVDSVAVVYVLEKRGEIPSVSSAYLGPFSTSCGCRCRENDPGNRQLTLPLLGRPGECITREASGPKTECDVLGGQWCQKESESQYALTGSTLPNGNLGCTEGEGMKLSIQQAFTPDPGFGGSI